MKIFAVNTIVHRDHLPVAFSVGDILPDWAIGKVGAHCLEDPAAGDAAPLDALADEDSDDDSSDPVDDIPDADDALEDPDAADVPVATDVPDFTKPARRAPARKK